MQFDSRMSSASDFVQKLQGNTGNNFARCPYLAHIEIERRKCLYGKGDDVKLMEALIQYFHGYITTPRFSVFLSSFFSDAIFFLFFLLLCE